jgi:hypothetical protein
MDTVTGRTWLVDTNWSPYCGQCASRNLTSAPKPPAASTKPLEQRKTFSSCRGCPCASVSLTATPITRPSGDVRMRSTYTSTVMLMSTVSYTGTSSVVGEKFQVFVGIGVLSHCIPTRRHIAMFLRVGVQWLIIPIPTVLSWVVWMLKGYSATNRDSTESGAYPCV